MRPDRIVVGECRGPKLAAYRPAEAGAEPPVATTSTASPAQKQQRQRISNLVRVGWPQAGGRQYHYEDARYPNLLTGISQQAEDGTAKRLSTYGYDGEGYAVLSESVATERVQIASRSRPQPEKDGQPGQPGHTELENGTGGKTHYTHAIIGRENRLLESRGAGCPTCGPGNMRYRYNKQSLVLEATQLNQAGGPISGLRKNYDAWGRTLRVERIDYAVKSKAAPSVQLLVRYEYAAPVKTAEGLTLALDRPTLMARPSVVPGREHRLEFAWNERGQLTQVKELGYRPSLPLPAGEPASGFIKTSAQPSAGRLGEPQPITRTRTYRYIEINGRSLLAEIDGPLPNGPKASPEDSDITRYHWDQQGRFIDKIEQPGGFDIRAFKRDTAGRVIRVSGASGATNLAYERNGALASAQSDDGFGVAYEYDPSGRRVSSFVLEPGRRIARTHRVFDAKGRLAVEIDATGRISEAVYDEKGRLAASRVSGAGFKQEERYEYDEQGRLIGVSDNTGATRRILRDASGRAVGFIDPLGRLTRVVYDDLGRIRRVERGQPGSESLHVGYDYDALGHLTAVAQQGMALGQQARRETRFAFDDFGRRIAEISGEAGAIERHYDAADRLVAERRANGDRSQYRYDASGKLLYSAQWAAASPGKPVTETHYQYRGGRLAEVQHPQGRETYRYDARGRLSEKTVQIKLDNGQWMTYPTRYRYDGSGRLTARSLPDGSEALYQRDAAGQIVALERQRAGGWFGPKTQTLAGGLARSVRGLDRIVYGNGVAGNWERSREGVLARTRYAPPETWGAKLVNLLPMGGKAQAAQAKPAAMGDDALPGVWEDARLPGTLREERLVYDAAGNIVATRRIDAGERVDDQYYGYDRFDQLMVAAGSRGKEGNRNARFYYHDPLGERRLTREGDTRTQRYAYDPAGRLMDGKPDALGRTTQLGARRLLWDTQGHLSGIEIDGRPVARYRYNHRHERIAKEAGGRTTHYLYENRQRVADLDETGRIVRQYLWLAGRLVAVIDPAGKAGEKTTYIHTNHLEAPVLATDAKGRAVWRAEYAPFGALRNLDDTAGLNLELRNPGQWHDAESGLYYNDRRYYDPQSGRYLSSDPLGLCRGRQPLRLCRRQPAALGGPAGAGTLCLRWDGE